MLCYKLTDASNETYLGTKWGPGVCHKTNGWGQLCSSGWLHAFLDPTLAEMMNTLLCGYSVLWVAEGRGNFLDDGLKCGFTQLTTLHKIPRVKVDRDQFIKFAILCALKVSSNVIFKNWAENWLAGIKGEFAHGYGAVAEDTVYWLTQSNVLSDTKYLAGQVAQQVQRVNANIDFIKLARKAMQ